MTVEPHLVSTQNVMPGHSEEFPCVGHGSVATCTWKPEPRQMLFFKGPRNAASHISLWERVQSCQVYHSCVYVYMYIIVQMVFRFTTLLVSMEAMGDFHNTGITEWGIINVNSDVTRI